MVPAILYLSAILSQNPRPSDWLSSGGDAQRSGWERSDSQFTKAGVKDFREVLARKLGQGGHLLAPIVVGRLISFKGFKELAIVAGQSGHLWAVDVDLDLVFWERELGTPVVSMPAMMPAPETGPARNAIRAIYVLGGNGRLFRINPSTGLDMAPPLDFLPAGARAGNLVVAQDVVYTAAGTTTWALDTATGKLASFVSDDGPVVGGPAVGTDGTVFVRTAKRLLALTGRDLQLRRALEVPDGNGLTVLSDRAVTAGNDGRLKFSSGETSAPVPAGRLSGGLAAGDGWVVASVRDPGGVVAFRAGDWKPAWVASGMDSPEAPVIANGVVFVRDQKTLRALDAETGSVLYSVAVQGISELSLANGRVYVTTADDLLRAFGPYQER